MKTVISTWVALLALAQVISAAPSAFQKRDVKSGNTTFVLTAFYAAAPTNVGVDTVSGDVIILQDNGASQAQQRFIYKPDTNGVVLDHQAEQPEQIVYVASDGHWQVTNGTSTPPPNSTTLFKIEPYEQAEQDSDQQLRAYRDASHAIPGEFQCPDATGKDLLYSVNSANVPQDCGEPYGFLSLLVTVVASS